MIEWGTVTHEWRPWRDDQAVISSITIQCGFVFDPKLYGKAEVMDRQVYNLKRIVFGDMIDNLQKARLRTLVAGLYETAKQITDVLEMMGVNNGS